MVKKYVARSGYPTGINRIDVERETASSVWVHGRRNAKRSSYDNYFNTWEDAHGFLLETAEHELALAQLRLDAARSKLELVKSLKPIK